MDNNTRFYLRRAIRQIKARERLEWMWDFCSTHGDSVENTQHKIGLANVAYEDEEQNRTSVIESLTRKSS